MRYLNQRLKHYYFGFLKSNDHHIGIPLLVSVLTYVYVSSSVCDFAPAYQFPPNRTTHVVRPSPWRSYWSVNLIH